MADSERVLSVDGTCPHCNIEIPFGRPVCSNGGTCLSALAVVGDPKLGCLHYLDTSDRCDTDRHVECLYGSGGWRGVDCQRDVAVQAADSVPHRHR